MIAAAFEHWEKEERESERERESESPGTGCEPGWLILARLITLLLVLVLFTVCIAYFI